MSEYRNQIIWGSTIAVIVALSIGITISYQPLNSPTNTSSTEQGKILSIYYVSLKAKESSNFYPTLWSSLEVGSALTRLTASIDGELVYAQNLDQENLTLNLQGLSFEVKNTNLNIVAGRNYSVSFTANFLGSNNPETISKVVVAGPASASNITAEGVTLCSKNCIYPAPYLSAGVSVNASVPLSSIKVFVNGTLITSYSYEDNNLTQYIIDFKSGLENMPIITGYEYVVTFVGMFADGTTSNSTSIVVAEN